MYSPGKVKNGRLHCQDGDVLIPSVQIK